MEVLSRGRAGGRRAEESPTLGGLHRKSGRCAAAVSSSERARRGKQRPRAKCWGRIEAEGERQGDSGGRSASYTGACRTCGCVAVAVSSSEGL